MNPQSAIVLMDAIALMNGNKTISEMIAELEAEVAKLTAIIEDMKVVDNVFSK